MLAEFANRRSRFYTHCMYTISFDAEICAVLLVWSGQPDSNEYQNAMIEGLELMTEHQCIKWLEDRRMLGDLHPENHSWARDVWFPKAILKGYKYCSIVLPELPLNSLTIEQIMEMLEFEIYTDYFDSIEDARDWLKNPLGYSAP